MVNSKTHTGRVGQIQAQLQNFFAERKKVRIYHGSTYSTRAPDFSHDSIIDTSDLNQVVEVNAAQKYALVEPNVSMTKLVEATLRHGLIPPVVMEFPEITVGGGIGGGAGESSSFKYGLFHDTCLEYEIVLGNGDRVTASRTKHADLFWGTACSFGSLCIITLVKLKLVPAKPFVRLTYQRVNDFAEAAAVTTQSTKGPATYVDSILFAKDRGVVMSGTLTDQTSPAASFRQRRDDWFYLHAEKICGRHGRYEESIPIRDYLFRYDRGGYWMGQHALQFLKIPFVEPVRTVLDGLLHTQPMYNFLHTTNLSQRFFIQDLSMPQKRTVELLEYLDDELGVYPVWLCPLPAGADDKFAPSSLPTDQVINVGVWGVLRRNQTDFVQINRAVEAKVKTLGGRKVLYAHAYYSPEEFWAIYDHRWYTQLRKKYRAESVFLDIYEKIRTDKQYKSSILRGIVKGLHSHKLPPPGRR